MMRKLKNEELKRLSVSDFKAARKFPVAIVLDDVRSRNNVGSAFRTADAFRIETIFLCGITPRPPHRDINKTALGATDSVSWEYFEDRDQLLSELRERNYKILVVEQVDGSQPLNQFQPLQNSWYALVFGNEMFGVHQDFIDQSNACLEIPQHGIKHSLNISVCIGVVTWDLFQKLGGLPDE